MIIILFSIFENIEFTTFTNAIGASRYGIYEQAGSDNPALTGIEDYVFAFDYRKLYSIADMGRLYIAYKNAGASLYYRKIGDLQNEGIFSFAFGLKLNDYARFGFKLKGFYLYQKDYGTDFSYGLDIGFSTKIWRIWNLGFLITNTNKPTFGKEFQYHIEPKLGFGLSYIPIDYFITTFGVEKEIGKDVRFLYGNILKLNEVFSLMAGFHSSPFEPTFGMKITTKFVSFNFAFSYNNELPSTYSVGVEYR